MLPNVLVLGAQRSGTTTIWHALDRHPDVFMSPTREIGFFSNDHLFNRGPAYYERTYFHGWNGEKACGEKTPEYLLMPSAAARIRDLLGSNVKLIALLRSPAERAYSGYRHNLMLGLESLPFHEALAAEGERITRNPVAIGRFGYVARGYYAKQLSRYLNCFDRDNLFIGLFDQLCQDQAAFLERLYRFIGVEPVRFPAPLREGTLDIAKFDINPSSRIVSYRSITIRNPSETLVTFASQFNRSMESLRVPSRDEFADINHRFFKDDILALRDLVSRDVNAWLG